MMTLGPPMTLGKTRILKKVAESKPCINWIFGDGCIHSETRQDDNEEVSRAVLSICLTLLNFETTRSSKRIQLFQMVSSEVVGATSI